MKLPYREIAMLLIGHQEHTELAERYLALRKRVKTLRRSESQIGAFSPLSQCGIKPPLSVAGESSDIIVRAEGLQLKGIPVFFDVDDEGRHLGFTIHEAQCKVVARWRQEVTPTQILDMYEELVSPEERAKIRDEIRKCKEEMAVLEKQIMEVMTDIDFKQTGRKLMAFPPANILYAAVNVAILNAIWKDRDWRSLVIAFHGDTLRVNGIRVAVGCGKGGGSGVIRTEDIQAVLSTCQPADTIELDFRDSGWIATVHRPSGISTSGREFSYYEE